MVRMMVVLVMVAALATPAVADPADPDPKIALGLSLGGTAMSVGVFAAGDRMHNDSLVLVGAGSLVLTPSFGHWYAGDGGGSALALRAGSAGAFLVGFTYVARRCLFGCPTTAEEVGAAVVVFGSIAGVVGGTIWDVVTAPRAACAASRTHVVPTVITRRSTSVPGLAIVHEF
jgi:hypothetical protein